MFLSTKDVKFEILSETIRCKTSHCQAKQMINT